MALELENFTFMDNINIQDAYARIEYFHINKKTIDELDENGVATGNKIDKYPVTIRVAVYTSEEICDTAIKQPIENIFIELDDFDINTLFTTVYNLVKQDTRISSCGVCDC